MKKSYSTLEIAKYCHVTYRTVANWIDDGRLESFKTAGGNRKVLREELVDFLKRQGMPLSDLGAIVNNIFVIDDERKVNNLIKSTLETDESYVVKTFTNPETAMVQVGIEKPDLILLDIHMPQMNGVSFYKAIKKIPSLKGTKVVFISGVTEQKQLKEDLGTLWKHVAFLKKPLDAKSILATVEKMLS